MADEEKVPVEDEGQESAEQPEEAPMTVSRRDFLIGAGAGAVVTGALGGGYIALQPREPAEVVEKEAEVISQEAASDEMLSEGVEERLITLNVNGQSYTVLANARSTLADVLRYQLGLTGSHIGCNRAECGACTIVMDGRNIYSCTQMAFASEEHEIITIEGLAEDISNLEGLHPIQRAFAINDGGQCNFCIPGQIMSAYALLQTNPNPSEMEVRRGLSGNICRCGNYQNIVQSVLAAADEIGG